MQSTWYNLLCPPFFSFCLSKWNHWPSLSMWDEISWIFNKSSGLNKEIHSPETISIPARVFETPRPLNKSLTACRVFCFFNARVLSSKQQTANSNPLIKGQGLCHITKKQYRTFYETHKAISDSLSLSLSF